MRNGDRCDSTIVLTALGVDLEGTKEALALYACAEESKEGWLNLLQDLRTRGATQVDLILFQGETFCRTKEDMSYLSLYPSKSLHITSLLPCSRATFTQNSLWHRPDSSQRGRHDAANRGIYQLDRVHGRDRVFHALQR